MSMRPRGAAAAARRPSRTGVRPVYEDFKPTFEWKHEEGASILLYHLPGFSKEQIRIIAESRGILRIQGERLATSNKWIRFQEEVAVPKNCNMSEIRAKFEGGILRITMPKRVEEQSTTSVQERPPLPSATKPPNMRPKFQPKLQEESSSKPTSSNIVENPQLGTTISPPPLIPRKVENKPQHEMQQEPIISQNKHTEDHIAPKDFTKNSDNERHESGQMPKHRIKENEMKERLKKVDSEVQPPKHEKYVDALDQVKHKILDGKKKVTESYYIPNKLNDDSKLLINMGVALLVIVTLGIYVYNSFGSTY